MSFFPLPLPIFVKALLEKVNGDEALGTVNTCNIKIKVRPGQEEAV